MSEHHHPHVIYLKDYTPPNFIIESVFLHFELAPEVTEVRAILKIHRNPESKHKNAPLKLNGEAMVLKTVDIDGKPLTADQYELTSGMSNCVK